MKVVQVVRKVVQVVRKAVQVVRKAAGLTESVIKLVGLMMVVRDAMGSA